MTDQTDRADLLSEIDIPEGATPSINPDLVRKYFYHEDQDFGFKQTLTLLDSMSRQRARAEYLCRVFMDKMIKLEMELRRAKEGRTGEPTEQLTRELQRVKTNIADAAKPKPRQRPSTPIVEGLDL